MNRVSVEEHAAHVAQLLSPALEVDAESVLLDEALDRVTVVAVASPVDLPLFRNSQMDGFAMRAADIADAPVRLTIAGESAAAATAPRSLEPGTAMRIMTGALVPDGADLVVPIERLIVDGETIIVNRVRSAGEFVRDRGSDLHAGELLVAAGVRLAPRHLAALAAAGVARVTVRRRIRIAVLTTGTELVEPGVTPELGQVFDSNGIALSAAIASVGAVVSLRRHVGDDVAAFLELLAEAAVVSDLILTSGGISMGDYEVVRESLEPLGARVGTVAMQPGGPQATAVFEGVPVVSFPGNPVSTQLSFEVFVAPLLRAVAARPQPERRTRALESDLVSVAGKQQFLRGRATEGDRVALVSGPGSHLVAALAASDLLVVIPAEVTQLAAGDSVETWAL